MKLALILALTLCALPAAAEVVAVSPNNAGGGITLTDDACPNDSGHFVAYATTREGNVYFGCWRSYNGGALVRYGDGSTRLYRADGFTFNENSSLYRNAERKKQQGGI